MSIIESSRRLMVAADELDEVSKALVKVELRLEIVEPDIEGQLESYIAALWEESQEGDTKKMPPQDVREALAQKSIPTDLKREYRALLATRRRCKSRLADLREIVAAHRSIVSAAKTELEATEGPQPQWSPN